MTDREKLIELIGQVQYLGGLELALADHLIANGVTFATDNNVGDKWISVKDRLPNRNDVIIAFYPTMRGTSGEMQIHKAWAMSDTCAHWMPLPEPPKGE